MSSISLLLPTRKRLTRAQAFLQSIVDTADDLSRIEVIAAIDADDLESQALSSPHPKLTLVKTIGPRNTMGALMTRCLKHTSNNLIAAVNDDIIIRSPHWDTLLLKATQAFPDEIYLLHTRDGFKDEKFPIFPILSRKTALKLIGDPFPEVFIGDGIDAHVFDIFLRLKDLGFDRILYTPDVFFEHLHYGLGKGKWDETYHARSAKAGNKIYHSLWRYRERLARRLALAIDSENSVTSLPLQHDTPPSMQPSLWLILQTFLYTKQSWRYRLSQTQYHFAREIYILLGLHYVKRWVKQWAVSE